MLQKSLTLSKVQSERTLCMLCHNAALKIRFGNWMHGWPTSFSLMRRRDPMSKDYAGAIQID